MQPALVLDACTELIRLALRFEHPADAIAAQFLREQRKTHAFGPRERAVLGDTLFDVLRRKPLLEHLAESGAGPKPRRLAILGFAGPRELLRDALSAPERAWLDRCDAAQSQELPARYRHNLPDWLADTLGSELAAGEFWPLVDSLNQPAPLDLRVNTLLAKRADLQRELAADESLVAEPTRWSPWGLRLHAKPSLAKLDAFRRGAIEVQDEGSQLLALLVGAKRGEMVVDFCAGSGGKTLALGASMRNTGRLYAFDTSAHRLAALQPRLARSGLSNVHPVAIAHERDDRIKRLAGKIDRVLVDAPCSGLGTLRRNPDLKWRQSPSGVAAMAQLQGAILASAARLLKPGGRLVYATCSLLPAENEEVAQAFSAAQPDFAPLAAGDLLAELKIDGVAALCSGPKSGLEYLRLWPHRHQTDGFFAAIWQRK